MNRKTMLHFQLKHPVRTKKKKSREHSQYKKTTQRMPNAQPFI